ncbi:serine hydrolase domain-containing protein [Flavihumibacter stibioxidans]|uniref:Peptidase n=1 Tax=Flavihumibacter stibioxidans TaxID=1834163 RepID=A0ABR7MDD8_9BACT|nr:serine hydrolase domain-containing protein [Flavihumibacter stibioxidans]MBC6493039.1 peptidase [Flavihumibacter stibioxidans]
MKPNIFLLCLALMAGFFLSAQSFDKAKLDRYFDALEQNNKLMGSVAVSKNGHLLYTRSIGYADVESGKKANDETKYRVGSISKTFTAVMVLKAAEKKKLSLDQSIQAYFPGIKHADKITIRHLLSHRSGIHNITRDKSYYEWNTTPRQRAELVKVISDSGSDFEPDFKAEYSNSNYILLSFILEEIYGEPYAKLLEQQIIKPLGLKYTAFGSVINSANNESQSYKYVKNWVKQPETHTSVLLGAGGVISTPADITKFAEALFGGKLLSQKSMDEMLVVKDGFGLGIYPVPVNDKKAMGHTGGIEGFASVFVNLKDIGVTIALSANGDNYNANKVLKALVSSVYNEPYEVPEFKVLVLSDEELNKYIGVYAAEKMPMKITISKDGNSLKGQAGGQNSFPLEATAKDEFRFDGMGLVITFDLSQNTLVLKQGGKEMSFKRE